MWVILLCSVVMVIQCIVIESQNDEIKRLRDNNRHLEWCIKQDEYQDALRKWIDVMEKEEQRKNIDKLSDME